jgi:hypothetical protein
MRFGVKAIQNQPNESDKTVESRMSFKIKSTNEKLQKNQKQSEVQSQNCWVGWCTSRLLGLRHRMSRYLHQDDIETPPKAS